MAFEFLSLLYSDLEALRQIVGEVKTTDGNGNWYARRRSQKDGKLGRVCTDVEQTDTEFALICGQRRFGSGDGFKNRVSDLKTSSISAGDGALQADPEQVAMWKVNFKARANHTMGSKIPGWSSRMNSREADGETRDPADARWNGLEQERC